MTNSKSVSTLRKEPQSIIVLDITKVTSSNFRIVEMTPFPLCLSEFGSRKAKRLTPGIASIKDQKRSHRPRSIIVIAIELRKVGCEVKLQKCLNYFRINHFGRGCHNTSQF